MAVIEYIIICYECVSVSLCFRYQPIYIHDIIYSSFPRALYRASTLSLNECLRLWENRCMNNDRNGWYAIGWNGMLRKRKQYDRKGEI